MSPGLSTLARRRLALGLSTLAAGWVSFAVYSETAAGRVADSAVTSLQDQNVAIQAEIDQRRRDVAAALQTQWLVEEARRLGYVLPGERVFVPVEAGADASRSGGVDTGPLPAPGPQAQASPTATAGTPRVPMPSAAPTPTPRPTPRVVVLPVPGLPSPTP